MQIKTNDWIIAGATLLYSLLFYQQLAGLNFTIFTIVLIGILIYKKPGLLHIRSWQFTAVATLISAACVGLHGSALTITAIIISLGILAGQSVAPHTSLVVTLLFSAYSILSAPVFLLIEKYEKREKNRNQTENLNNLPRWLALGIFPVIISLVFFLLYRNANPIFDVYAAQINFNFISVSWLFFTTGGFLLIYSFLYHRQLETIAIADAQAPNQLPVNKVFYSGWLRDFMNVPLEYSSGIVLFGLLNLLLLTVNIIDISFLYAGNTLPEVLTFADAVHQGVGALITSIILAIIIILFYFRGALNFYHNNKWLKFLAYSWILQNAFMVISTAHRNTLYIVEYSLTYKRIGVYVYLLLTLIGLFYTLIKILKIKTNWYLFRQNAWAFYVVLVLSSFFNWDIIIAKYNIQQAEKQGKALDQLYLINLSYATLPYVQQYQEKNAGHEWEVRRQYYKYQNFTEKNNEIYWQSWSLNRLEIAEKMLYLTGQPQNYAFPENFIKN